MCRQLSTENNIARVNAARGRAMSRAGLIVLLGGLALGLGACADGPEPSALMTIAAPAPPPPVPIPQTRTATDVARIESELMSLAAEQDAATRSATPPAFLDELKSVGSRHAKDAKKRIEDVEGLPGQ